MTTTPRYRNRVCSVTLPAWIPVPGEPNGAMLLHHLAQAQPAELRPFLDQMHVTDDTTSVIVQAYEAVDEPPRRRTS